MPDIKVKTKNGLYSVFIGSNISGKLTAQLKKNVGKNRVFVLIDSNVFALYGKPLSKILSKFNTAVLVIPSGESSKSHTELQKVYDFLFSEKINRSDFILAVGGGVLTDIAGYAAATTMRGIRWGAVSTTLLGMVDAAIGGKTGINHPRGKNLVGAFWQPQFVLGDLNFLNTLPEREIIAGLGEILKYAGLSGIKMIRRLDNYLKSGDLLNFKTLKLLIEQGVSYKAMIVTKDEREGNIRMFLNLGHTFAHAIEKALGYKKLLHGEAVIIGLNAAVILSKYQSMNSNTALKEYGNLVKTFLGFVRYYPLNVKNIMENMNLDKKRRDAAQNFVLLKRPGSPFIASRIKTSLIEKTIKETLLLYRKLGLKRG